MVYLQLVLILGTHVSPCFRMGWAEAGAQMELEEAFGMGGFGYPVSDRTVGHDVAY